MPISCVLLYRYFGTDVFLIQTRIMTLQRCWPKAESGHRLAIFYRRTHAPVGQATPFCVCLLTSSVYADIIFSSASVLPSPPSEGFGMVLTKLALVHHSLSQPHKTKKKKKKTKIQNTRVRYTPPHDTPTSYGKPPKEAA